MQGRTKSLELFGGIGAPFAALRNIEELNPYSIAYVEIDEKAVNSYNKMFEKELKHQPTSVVGFNLKPDVLVHGSPCQDFSIAGRQKGADKNSGTRSSLMWETLKIIKDMGVWKPKVVIWENVKNVISQHMVHNFNKYLSEMEKLGYTNSFECLNAMEFGIPQDRDRIFTISCLDGTKFDFSDLLRTKPNHISEYLQPIEEIEAKYFVTQPSMLSRIGNTNKKGSFSGRVNVIDDKCWTITTKQVRCPNAGVIDIGNGKYRYLTELECWRLQGFRDEDYYAALEANPGKEGCMNTALYKQAGNSIPVPILESIFRKLFLGQTEEPIQLRLSW